MQCLSYRIPIVLYSAINGKIWQKLFFTETPFFLSVVQKSPQIYLFFPQRGSKEWGLKTYFCDRNLFDITQPLPLDPNSWFVSFHIWRDQKQIRPPLWILRATSWVSHNLSQFFCDFLHGVASLMLWRENFFRSLFTCIADWLLGSPLNPKLIFSLVDWIRFLKESILYRQPHFYF